MRVLEYGRHKRWSRGLPRGSSAASGRFRLGISVAGSQSLNVDSMVLTDYPFSLAIWCKTSQTAAQAAIFLGDKDDPGDYVRLGCDSSGLAQLAIVTPGGTTATAGVAIDDDVPHLLVGVFTSATDRTLYVDNQTGVTSAVSRTFPAIDRLSIGRIGDSTPSTFWIGSLDEAIVFDDTVTDAERMILWNGVTIDRIADYSAALYAKIMNAYPLDANEAGGFVRDAVGGLNLTNSGAVSAAGLVQ